MDLLNIYELEETLKSKTKGIKYSSFGILFCFGTSLVSRLIQAKTRMQDKEVVPSHVLIIYGEWIFESTTEVVNTFTHKKIPSGVRMWKLEEYIDHEKSKSSKYYLYKYNKFDKDMLLSCLHLPYGKDNIIDFILKDTSEGDRTYGLICSQYVNKVTKLSKQRCPTPADLFRIVKDIISAKE